MGFCAALGSALRFTLLLWLLTVVVVTLPLLGVARLVAPEAAGGSLLRRDGVVVGSRLIGQPFHSARYLQGRPSGDPNVAALSPALTHRVAAAAQAWQGAGIERPAADLLLDSASGVDPHISVGAAQQQLPRLARERGLSVEHLEGLLRQSQEGPLTLRAIEPVVNVLTFNLALDGLSASPPATSLRRFTAAPRAASAISLSPPAAGSSIALSPPLAASGIPLSPPGGVSAISLSPPAGASGIALPLPAGASSLSLSPPLAASGIPLSPPADASSLPIPIPIPIPIPAPAVAPLATPMAVSVPAAPVAAPVAASSR